MEDIIKHVHKYKNEAITAELLHDMFYSKSEGIVEKPFTITRKKLNELVTEFEFPDDKTLMKLFYEFLAREFAARGTAVIKKTTVMRQF